VWWSVGATSTTVKPLDSFSKNKSVFYLFSMYFCINVRIEEEKKGEKAVWETTIPHHKLACGRDLQHARGLALRF
jgi:hypothetical protein